MSRAIKEFVQSKINSDTVVIFSKTYCGYSRKAKEVFEKLNMRYTAVELDKRDDGFKVQDVLEKMTGARSVPRVFLKGRFIGGAADVLELHRSGRLKKML